MCSHTMALKDVDGLREATNENYLFALDNFILGFDTTICLNNGIAILNMCNTYVES